MVKINSLRPLYGRNRKYGYYYNDNVDGLSKESLTVRVNTDEIKGKDAAAETIRRKEGDSASYAKDAIEIHVRTETFSVNEWGSIMGHEMIHAVYYRDHFMYRGYQPLWKNEVKGYQWQIDHSKQFNNPFSIDNLTEQQNKFR